jgi:hypothetical protein
MDDIDRLGFPSLEEKREVEGAKLRQNDCKEEGEVQTENRINKLKWQNVSGGT